MFQTVRWRLMPLVIVAAVLTVPLLQHIWKIISLNQTAQAVVAAAPHHGNLSGVPIRIVVPSAIIDLPVVPGSQDIHTQIWSVAASAANYATISAPANNIQGKTLIYGHNNHRVFGSLLDLKPGATALIYSANHHIFTYVFTSAHDVTPNQLGVLASLQQGTGLVLLTCDGNYFQYRRVMYFDLVKDI